MNLLLSATLFNPLEAFVLLMACNIFTNNKFKNIKSAIIHSYSLGSINLLIQFTLNLLPSGIFHLIANLFCMFILGSFVVFLYYNICVGKIRFKKAFAIQVLYLATMFLILYLIDIVLGKEFMTYYNSLLNETFDNLIIRISQIILLIFYKNLFVKKD